MSHNYIDEYAEATCQDWADGMVRLVPPRMVPGLVRYIVHGFRPGHFLSAVLSNDLMNALRRGDDENRQLLPEYGTFLYNYAPSECFGSDAAFDSWKGLPVQGDNK